MRKLIIKWLQHKGIYVLRKIPETQTMFKDGLGRKYSIIRKK